MTGAMRLDEVTVQIRGLAEVLARQGVWSPGDGGESGLA